LDPGPDTAENQMTSTDVGGNVFQGAPVEDSDMPPHRKEGNNKNE